MKATEILMGEHRVIERVISALEKGAERLQAGLKIRAGFFIDAAEFIKGFADGCHHQKEEGVLFKTMEAHGIPKQDGPIGVMLFEHEQGRKFTSGLRDAALKLENGDESAVSAIISNAQEYATLLRQHIHKEDNILFPIAERVIPELEKEKVLEDFKHIEHEETGAGVHEKYLALAEKLENEIE